MAQYPDYGNMPAPNWLNQGQVTPGRANPYSMTPQNDPMAGNFYRSLHDLQTGGPDKDDYNEYIQQGLGQQFMNPYSQYGGAVQRYDQFMGRQENAGLQYNADQTYNNLAQKAGTYGQDLAPSMRNQALGRNPIQQQMLAQARGRQSVVGAQAQVERQNAMRDIAQQASMQQGASYNPAIARMALMQQSGVGQSMAAQVAADKMRERQMAQQAYMQSLQQGQQGYLGLGQQQLSNLGNVQQVAQGRLGAAQNTYGSLMNIGQGAYAGQTSAINQNENLAETPRVQR